MESDGVTLMSLHFYVSRILEFCSGPIRSLWPSTLVSTHPRMIIKLNRDYQRFCVFGYCEGNVVSLSYS